MKNVFRFIAAVLVAALGLGSGAAQAQFTAGTLLTAAQLNYQFSLYVPIAGGTLTGPLTVPTLSTANATVTGGAISGLSVLASPGTASFGNQTTWLNSLISCTTACAQTWSQSSGGGIGLIGASRTSDNPLAGSMASQGVAGYGINNNTAQVQTTYGGYFEARKASGAGTTQGVEMDMVNQGSVIQIDPYQMIQAAITPDLWLSSGRPDTTTGAANATAAIGIINNNTAFESGLVMQSGALDNSTGEGSAVVLPANYGMVWYGSAGTKVARIRSDATTASLGLVFSNGFLNFETAAGAVRGTMDTSGNLSAYGNVSADTTTYLLGNIAGQALPGNNTSTGASSIGWNRSSGSGETDFVNSPGGGATGGFQWYQWNGTSATETGALDPVGNFSAAGTVNTSGYTVATLPTGKAGARAYVTDATACAYAASLTGGGANFCPVVYNGSAWVADRSTVPLYSTSGTLVSGPHMVTGSVALAAGTATVTLSGSAAYTSSTSYACTANDTTAAAAVKVGQTSGTSITFTGTSTDTVQFMCAGS